MTRLKVFLSYRRADSQLETKLIADQVRKRSRLFMDIDSIDPGSDFPTVLRSAIDESDVLLVVIGRHYLDVGPDGERRIDKPDDLVVEEVATGLERGIEVIPVLVDGAVMPSAAELPSRLQALARRQAVTVANRSFDDDADGLVADLDDIRRAKFLDAGPVGRRRLSWLTVLATVFLLTVSELLLDDYRRPGLPLLLLSGGLCAALALLVRDCRRLRSRPARILLRSGLAAAGLGTTLYFASHSLVMWLGRHGFEVRHDYYPVLLVLPVIAAAGGYLLLRPEAGRTAVWPSLILVLISAACFALHVVRVNGPG